MNNNRCLICGEIIPEGIQVCPNCFVTSQKPKEKILEPKTIKQWQKIKQMNKEELTAFLFLFAQAYLKAGKGELSKETQRYLYKSISEELNKEVSPKGITTSKIKP